MNYWIKRGGRLFGIVVFFIVLIILIGRPEGLQIPHLITACVYAFIAGMISWLAGTIVSDIILKGIISDLTDLDEENILEGGLIQRVMMMQEKLIPGNEEMPFVEVQRTEKSAKKGRGKSV